MTLGLPVSRLISVSVNLDPLAAQFANFNSLLIVGDSDVIDTYERIRTYGTLAEVANDFGTSVPEYLAADLYFSQAPQPTQLYIGRWAQSATAGLLVGGILTAAEQAMSNWTSITTGSFKIAEDGGSVTAVTSCDFAGLTNLNAVATEINTRLAAASLTTTCAWTGENFVFTSGTTGSSSNVSFLTTDSATGVDISAQLMGTAATAQYVVNGIVAESAVACVEILDDLSTSWYGLNMAATALVDSDCEAIAAYIEGSGNPHLFNITTQNTAALSPTDSTSIGYVLKGLGYKRTFCQYSSSSPYAAASMFGRLLTTNFNANNTLITLAYKTEPGVLAETLTSTQASALDSNYYNYFAFFNNNTAIIVNGQVASGNYIDEIYGTDWLANNIQTNVFNLLLTTTTKIPQTDQGNHQIVNVIEASCAQGVANGLLGTNLTWTAGGFGTLNTGDILPKGYYVYAPPIALQNQSDRQARKSVPIQVAAKLAGAIQSVDVIVNVNR